LHVTRFNNEETIVYQLHNDSYFATTGLILKTYIIILILTPHATNSEQPNAIEIYNIITVKMKDYVHAWMFGDQSTESTGCMLLLYIAHIDWINSRNDTIAK